MKIIEGYSYHIKDKFFNDIADKYLMKNKENGNYRPHYYAIKDMKDPSILWMIPISSKVKKYEKIIKNKKGKYGKCNTIVIGIFAGNKSVFLLQNAFPILPKYLDHIHTVQGKEIQVHKLLKRELEVNLKTLIALKNRKINLFFSNIDEIYKFIKNKY
ncbi:type III toxin-antitoxin system CptIN family toxin [Oceanivirga miroungae]|uniref:Uncharacterized protein n=1 Tax=Oceanivirga miroungae TaxID=1130046 RepID=A0A6I8M6B3_9FUSO|nr:hypothetical protein [Oceanivirga miroungae]VWL84974.1 hypothetical protein OMES3154_00246 [Oceanivirga miroungae]